MVVWIAFLTWLISQLASAPNFTKRLIFVVQLPVTTQLISQQLTESQLSASSKLSMSFHEPISALSFLLSKLQRWLVRSQLDGRQVAMAYWKISSPKQTAPL